MKIKRSSLMSLGGAFVVATMQAQAQVLYFGEPQRRVSQLDNPYGTAPQRGGNDAGMGNPNNPGNNPYGSTNPYGNNPGAPGTSGTTNRNVRNTGGVRLNANGEVLVVPRVFMIEGNKVVSTRELNALLAPYIGRAMTFEELNRVTDVIREHYQRRGYILASAFLPEQQVNTGVIRIGVQEGQLGQVRVRQPFDPNVRVSEEQVRSIISNNVRPGAPVSESQLERPMLLVEDMAGAQVRSSIVRGQQRGTADLEVEVVPDKRKGFISGSVELDNFGNTATGRERLTLKLDVNGLLGAGDTLTTQTFVTNQRLSVFGNATYQLPVGADGMKVGAGIGKLTYTLGGEFAALEASGQARTAEAFVSYPFVRGRNGNVIGRISAEDKQVSNAQAFGVQQTTNVRGMKLQLSMDMRDTRSSTVLALNYQIGTVNMPDPTQAALDASVNGFKTQGRFSKGTADLQHLQTVGRAVAVLKASGQMASKNLAGVEKFSLGGPDRLRGFAPGTGSGDSGFAATAEVRVPLDGPRIAGGGFTASAFFDVGHVTRNRRTDDAPAADRTQPNGRTLTDAGVGLRFGQEDRFVVRAELARPLSDTWKAANQKDKFRFWLQSMFWF